nr:MAG TPA: hypothetical protein [Caudoviricetes sp.]
MPYTKVRNCWQWVLSVKLLHNWVCQLAQLVTMAHQYMLAESVKMEGD